MIYVSALLKWGADFFTYRESITNLDPQEQEMVIKLADHFKSLKEK